MCFQNGIAKLPTCIFVGADSNPITTTPRLSFHRSPSIFFFYFFSKQRQLPHYPQNLSQILSPFECYLKTYWNMIFQSVKLEVCNRFWTWSQTSHCTFGHLIKVNKFQPSRIWMSYKAEAMTMTRHGAAILSWHSWYACYATALPNLVRVPLSMLFLKKKNTVFLYHHSWQNLRCYQESRILLMGPIDYNPTVIKTLKRREFSFG